MQILKLSQIFNRICLTLKKHELMDLFMAAYLKWSLGDLTTLDRKTFSRQKKE